MESSICYCACRFCSELASSRLLLEISEESTGGAMMADGSGGESRCDCCRLLRGGLRELNAALFTSPTALFCCCLTPLEFP